MVFHLYYVSFGPEGDYFLTTKKLELNSPIEKSQNKYLTTFDTELNKPISYNNILYKITKNKFGSFCFNQLSRDELILLKIENLKSYK